jgi:hypothetical protein
MKSLHVSMLAGHDKGIKKHYHIPNESVVLKDFMIHAQDALTIDGSQRLKQENQGLKVTQAQEIAQLKAQLQRDKEEMYARIRSTMICWKKPFWDKHLKKCHLV